LRLARLAALAVLAVLTVLVALVAVPAAEGSPSARESHRARRFSAAGARRGARAHSSIVGGMPAEPGSFPWLAAVFHEGPGEAFECSGTVIAPNVILTAAHCVEDVATGRRFSASGYAVVTGNVDWTRTPRQILGVSLTVVYPGFKRSDASGDAALLVLATPTSAPPLALASRAIDGARLAAGRYAVMAGWGETFAGGPAPSELQWARTSVQSAGFCRRHTRTFVASEEICTLDTPAQQTDACFGDSGGPLLGALPGSGEFVELGVASHLYTDCLASSPAVYTRADLIRAWVDDWIASARYVLGTRTSTAPGAQPTAQPARAPAIAPGGYSARPAIGEAVSLEVTANREWLTRLGASALLGCRNGASLPLSLRWPGEAVFIYAGTAKATLAVRPGGVVRGGSADLSVRFLAPASLRGELRIRVQTASRQLGSCSGQLAFTASG
jgi:secreted trypsin-like serine protease